eukprot:gene7797-9983_t
MAPRHGSSDNGGGRGEVAHRDETWRRALSLLLSLKPGFSLSEAVLTHPNGAGMLQGIDIQRLVAYAQFKGYIRIVDHSRYAKPASGRERVGTGARIDAFYLSDDGQRSRAAEEYCNRVAYP